MSDIELVIKLSEEEYKYIKGMQSCILGIRGGKGLLSKILNAVRTGMPLPKRHGRIADVDKMLDEMRATRTYDILFTLERVKPILEADKEDEKNE